MRCCFSAWPKLLLLLPVVTATLPPSVDAAKGNPGLLERATALLVGVPTALRGMFKNIDATFLLEEGIALGQGPASRLEEASFARTIQPNNEWVLEVGDDRSARATMT